MNNEKIHILESSWKVINEYCGAYLLEIYRKDVLTVHFKLPILMSPV